MKKTILLSTLFCWFLSVQNVLAQPANWLSAPTCTETSGLNFVIDANVNWNTPGVYEVRQTIRVLDSAILTIANGVELHFVPGTGIVVEQGGQLIINGTNTLLTSSCRTNSRLIPWEGIDVKGTANVNDQTIATQGVVTITDATISNAKVGIEQLGGCTEIGGGVIQVNTARFMNNFVSLKFSEHRAYNASHVQGSHFEIDSGFMQFGNIEAYNSSSTNYDWRLWNKNHGQERSGQIILESNDGLVITNCDFLNHFSADAAGNASSPPTWNLLDANGNTIQWPTSVRLWSDPTWQSSAIYGTESQFRVEATNNCTDGDSNLNRNHFVGWYHGVHAFYSNFAFDTIHVSGSVFRNNKYGVYISHAERVEVEDNYFIETDNLFSRLRIVNADNINSPSAANTYGVFVRERIDEIVVLNNRFNSTHGTNFGGNSAFLFYAKSNFFPEELRLQNNSFYGEVTHHASFPPQELNVQTVVRMKGIRLFNIGTGTDASHRFYMDCNTFNYRNAGATFNTNKHYERHDLLINGVAGTNPSITIESYRNPGSVPLTKWSDFSSQTCGRHSTSPFVNYVCYNIEADLPVTYPVYTSGALTDFPSCIDTNYVVRQTASVAPTDSCPGICGNLDPTTAPMQLGTENNEHSSEVLRGPAGFDLFPNPTSGALRIDAYKDGNISILDINGKKVTSDITITQGVNTVDVSNLAKGEYFVQLRGKDTSSTRKFIKY
ncbi:MAG: T9SS type A sorting domain-containing protein [Bacteroidia bacterium]|nr:T9SS type A sorting domain-containing protein [Bacteroidia bacterium]